MLVAPNPFDSRPPRGEPLPPVPRVACACLDVEGFPEPHCSMCDGCASVDVRCCWCKRAGELTDVESRDVLCRRCDAAFAAYATPEPEVVMHGANADGSLVHEGCRTCAMTRPFARAL